MELVLGVDLGTSAVKVSAVNNVGEVVVQESFDYPLIQEQPGYSEQNPEEWVSATTMAIVRLILNHKIVPSEIKGISYSGQMHGLVLLDSDNKVIRPAILWNDTRTTPQCQEIDAKMGDKFVDITGHKPLEGFTITKILWVKENEPENWKKVKTILLPKDYLRYKMTGNLRIDYSDASGTALLDESEKMWSKEICEVFNIPKNILPQLVESSDFTGNITQDYAEYSGLTTETKTFAGAADNAAGAIGAGILNSDDLMVSIGTSGVVLKFEDNFNLNYHGELQFENHALNNNYYSMGVTLAAGYSLNWFKRTFSKDMEFSNFVALARDSPIGANGLLFTPYIVGERTPYPDSSVRGSFIGIDGTHRINDFVRSVLEGIIYSFKDIIKIYEDNSAQIHEIISIGGGAKSDLWLQIQADIFNKDVVKLQNEQGPGLGAAMIAAVGVNWFDTLQDSAKVFVKKGRRFQPIAKNVAIYDSFYKIYAQIYMQTKDISKQILDIKSKGI